MGFDIKDWWCIQRSSGGLMFMDGDEAPVGFLDTLKLYGFEVMVLSITRIAPTGRLYTMAYPMVRIPDMEMLRELGSVTGFPLILFFEDRPRSIEIYDSYRE